MQKVRSRANKTVSGVLPPPPLTRQETIEALLEQAGRGAVPIRKTFVQQGHGNTTTPGPLAQFLHTHDDRGLELYLLLHALASTEPWNCDYPSDTWVRALGLRDTASQESARSAVSKTLARLDDRQLIAKQRSGRWAGVTLLREDGSGSPYERPTTSTDKWLQLPHAYWLDGHYTTISLPAKVMLLIALSLPDDFPLPADRAPRWYGVSASSAQRGLDELQQAGILTASSDWIQNQKSVTGWIERRTYIPIGPFAFNARQAAAKTRPRRTSGGN